ncbi:MAG: hypothetical protein GXP48_11255 [Acidobacteria bacterium]|nr:hypothetical protein [Acidobacteriota bacterium]
MNEQRNLSQAIEDRGAYAVWDLLNEDEKRAAAAATWKNADHESRSALEVALAKELKFRPKTVGHLPAEKVSGRLVHLAKKLPDTVIFQFLFHLHLDGRKPLLIEFLDDVGLPNDDGVLDLPDDTDPPDTAKVAEAAQRLIDAHGHQALIYLATLKVADKEFWAGVEGILERHAEDGTPLEPAEPPKETS